MNAAIARWGLVYPVHLLRGEWAPLHCSKIQAVDSLSASALHSYQEEKLGRLLKWVSYNDPYYRRILAEPVASGKLERPLEFLSEMPFLTKAIIAGEELGRKHRVWECLDRRSTSGSTGTPFSFYKDRLATGTMEAVQNHVYSWHGIRVGEPQGRFWGMPPGRSGSIARCKDRLKNRIRFSAFNLSAQAKCEYFARMHTFRPTYFYGYPSLMLEFARFLVHEKLSLAEISLKVAIGTGEYVYQHERQEIEQLLRVPYVSEYGCTEVGVIGFECPYKRMHLMSANIILEVVDSAGRAVAKGSEGEFVITELSARYFPFVRYRIGDRGRLTGEACPCGRVLPVFEVSAGRKDDFIVTPEGGKVYDAILAYTLKKGVGQFNAVQDRVNRLRIFVRPTSQFTEALQKQYVAQLQQAISPAMEIEIVVVDEIKREKSGKIRYFRSDIDKERQ